MKKLFGTHDTSLQNDFAGYAQIWYSTIHGKPLTLKFPLQDKRVYSNGIHTTEKKIILAHKCWEGIESLGDYSQYSPTTVGKYKNRAFLYNGSEVLIGHLTHPTTNLDLVKETCLSKFIIIRSNTKQTFKETAKKLQLPLEQRI